MTKRRSLTPGNGIPAVNGVHAMRRGGARHEVTERVTLRSDTGVTLEGWALNISRGGVRVILEGNLALGEEYDVTVGDEDPQLSTRGRIVWLQEEPDGYIVGVEFIGLSGTHRAVAAPVTPVSPAPDHVNALDGAPSARPLADDAPPPDASKR